MPKIGLETQILLTLQPDFVTDCGIPGGQTGKLHQGSHALSCRGRSILHLTTGYSNCQQVRYIDRDSPSIEAIFLLASTGLEAAN